MGADISTQKNCYILFQSKQASLTININCVYYKTPWRNGSASDSRSEGCVFESCGVKQFLSEQLPFNQRQKLTLPPMRIELMTFGLQDQRSATEL